MCLSVYLGCHDELPVGDVPEGSLGIEAAQWKPPPLANLPFVYYLGRKGNGDELECSCLLAQHVEWTENGLTVCLDGLYSEAPSCPFKDLRSHVEAAQRNGKPVVMVCDDSGGCEQKSSDEDYDHLVINAEMISPATYLFADPVSLFPWRAFDFVAPKS